MRRDDIPHIIRTLQDLEAFLQEAERLSSAFSALGMPVPEEVLAVTGGASAPTTKTNGHAGKEPASQFAMEEATPTKEPEATEEESEGARPAPALVPYGPNWSEWPAEPHYTDEDWLWLPLRDLNVQNLVLALLRRATKPLTTKELYSQASEIKPLSFGSLQNVCMRLNGKQLQREEGAYTLRDFNAAPLIDADIVWGHRRVFDVQEVANHRRRAIMRALEMTAPGLTQMELVRRLQFQMPECVAPINKSLIKMDLTALEKSGNVERLDPGKLWRVKRAA